jgi:hypothetical protein
MGHPVRITGGEVSRALQVRSREPLMGVLGRLIEAQPTPDALAAFAEKEPRKWAQAVEVMARLAGYREDQPEANFQDSVAEMSDAEIEVRLADIQTKISKV